MKRKNTISYWLQLAGVAIQSSDKKALAKVLEDAPTNYRHTIQQFANSRKARLDSVGDIS